MKALAVRCGIRVAKIRVVDMNIGYRIAMTHACVVSCST